MDQQTRQGRLWPIVRLVVKAIWRFLGRMGLAIRQLLTWFIWLPLYFLTMPLWLPLRWSWQQFKPFIPQIWRFIGSTGLAIRKLWLWAIWEPFIWLLTPLIFLLKRVIWPISKWVYRIVRRVALFLGGQLARFGRMIWRISAPRRHLWRRVWRSRWLVWRSRFWWRFKRPSPLPLQTEVAPAVPRPELTRRRTLRLATAFASVAVLLMVGLISLQEREPVIASASAVDQNRFSFPKIIVLTPTPLPASPTPVPTAVLTPWPTPDLTQGGGAILFSQHVNGNSDIYLLPVGQAEAVRITSHVAADRHPSWSPDGSRFAFASQREGQWDIFVYDIRQGTLRNVTDDLNFDGAPTWSPDGEWLAYESYQQENLDIYLVKVSESQNPIRLTRHPAADYAPSWEPINGRHIAFTSWRPGAPDILIRSLDDPLAERVINVTNSPDEHENGAIFAPDGRSLAYFVSSRDFNLVRGVSLSEQVEPIGSPRSLGQQGSQPAWAPDNKALVYVYEREGQSFLVAGSPDAWGVTPQVYAGAGEISSPSWTAVQFMPTMVDSLANIDGELTQKPLYVEALAETVIETPAFQLFELSINAPSPYLTDRVDQSFLALREHLLTAVGWDILGRLDGMFTALAERPLPGQPTQNWNKAGRAFDLSYQEALSLDPQIEVVPEWVGNDIFWRIYVKTELQDGSQGEPLRARPWDFRARSGDDPQYYDQGGKLRAAIPAGYYVDLTAVAEDYGWQRVPARANWKTYFPDIQFWHFEKREGLTWTQAMQEIYTSEELAVLSGDRGLGIGDR